jgi:hypothetical protein
VIDISDPTTPTLAGSYDTPRIAQGIAISGDYAYVADYFSGLLMIDISDPTTPSLVGSYDTPDIAQDVAISGDYAYVADCFSGLQVIDISDPTNPVLEGIYDTPGKAYGVAISGDYAYVGDGTSGLQVIDIYDLAEPALAGSYDTPDYAYGVTISGDHAFVGDMSSGLQVIDISDPPTLSLAGSYDTPGRASGVAISGDYAYVTDDDAGLQVIDISDPTTPALAGSYDTPGYARSVAISGDYACITDGYQGLKVIDISDPTTPALAGSYDTPGFAYGITISGDHAYVAAWTSGLQVLDISDPATPVFAGGYGIPGYAIGIAVSGDYAYVACQDSGLQVMDISDPTTPTLAGGYDTPGSAWGVTISGDYAYVACEDSGLQVIDISDPTTPALVDSYNTPGNATGVAIWGDYAYVADGMSGLQVITVFERRFDTYAHTARSLSISGSDKVVLAARLSSIQTDSIGWELSADSGSSWQEFLPDGGDYQHFISPGSDPIWKSLHIYTGAGINPACSSLEIELLYDLPIIESIEDIPSDQGKQVSLSWVTSGYDAIGSTNPIMEYAVYRRIDPGPSGPPDQDVSARLCTGVQRLKDESAAQPLYPPGDWHFILTVPARAEDEYAVVVPTLADSTVSAGQYYTTFFVSALTSTPGIYFDSPVDSGYSLDNMAPSPPSGLMMASATDLAWDECPNDDFDYFTVYGSAGPGLDTTAVLVGYTIEIAMDVTGDQYEYYHVTATDFSGNEGDASSVENGHAGAKVEKELPESFALKQNRPNPFKSGTVISFDLPEPCAVRLEIVDVQGRVVRFLTDKAWPAGRHSVAWAGENDAGKVTGPGVYFVRIKAGGFTAINKMLRMK